MQRVRLEHHVHRAIRPQHQQLRRLAPLRQDGQEVHRRPITPLQVFQHEYQRRIGCQHVERLREFAPHAGRGRPGHLVLQPLEFRRADQPRQLHQPQGGILPQHCQEGVPRRTVGQLPQGLEERQVRFALPIVLDALAPPGPHTAPCGQVGQEAIDHRRLANPHVATDQDELARTVDRLLEPHLQPRDGWLAPDDGAGRPGGRLFCLACHPKLIPMRGDRLEILRHRRRVTQRGANLPDTHPQDRVAHMRAAPDVLAQLRFGHQAAGMRDEIA